MVQAREGSFKETGLVQNRRFMGNTASTSADIPLPIPLPLPLPRPLSSGLGSGIGSGSGIGVVSQGLGV